jgi:hypothetical protein
MGYDAAREKVLLFGGHSLHGNNFQDYGDLWEWDGVTWRELAPTTAAPGVRNIARLVFDPLAERMLLFGGGDGGGTFVSDLWAWDGTQWTQIAASGAPERSGLGGAYDVVRNVVVLFGGVARPGGQAITETWEWDGQVWQCRDGCQ